MVEMNYSKTFTVTFGEIAENHVGMEKIGKDIDVGLELSDLQRVQNTFTSYGAKADIYHLNNLLPEGVPEDIDNAYFCHIKNGMDVLFKASKGDGRLYTAEDVYREHDCLNPDTTAKMRGKVVNKHARHNLCFSDFEQAADIENGKGTVIPWNKIPLTNHIRKCMEVIVGPKTKTLQGEGNYYYNLNKCGIGFHGDAERKIVIAFRVGATFPLHYQWFHRFLPVGNRFILNVEHGDIYLMSFKATGNDWRKSSQYTLRHAAGSPKYTTIKKKK